MLGVLSEETRVAEKNGWIPAPLQNLFDEIEEAIRSSQRGVVGISARVTMLKLKVEAIYEAAEKCTDSESKLDVHFTTSL